MEVHYTDISYAKDGRFIRTYVKSIHIRYMGTFPSKIIVGLEASLLNFAFLQE